MFQKAHLPGHKEFCKASSNGSGSAASHGFASASRWSFDSWASKCRTYSWHRGYTAVCNVPPSANLLAPIC